MRPSKRTSGRRARDGEPRLPSPVREWQPEPLELPLELPRPVRAPSAEHGPDDEAGRTVIVIDLA